ncbi:hypothetical protein M409DRAFT_52687 [Zasmidium cellare ATCC 36951]|uniref:Uncharacterized protein n=1 Tax=Zasmidium cellare ATCC 36951 TaxID=1080233 RepID=A0A6A6CTD6_ZASCE|nr:uncharacterized protein M409DRAFT_52687 [Zasmidium cellare ATCC 36951]KAF2169448.1 hypothetical protein M409DRAFT_52687 [Zasmidium cellare ATCC 36951]
MVLISTQIEIAAPPERVREILLDFPRLNEWHQSGHFKSIEIAARKTEGVLSVGDKLKVVMEEMTFTPVILKNDPSELKWRGSLPLIFTGDHSYRFLPSETIPGGTLFIQEENFTGLLSPVMKVKEGKRDFAWKNLRGFEGLNADLKAEAERVVGIGEGRREGEGGL